MQVSTHMSGGEAQRATWSCRADSRRPLVIGTRLRARVDADGPALRVRAAGRAEARYPLARVSRVLASLRVDWAASALRACLEAGIPVVMLGVDGVPLGSLHPAAERRSTLSDCIEELLDRADASEVYGNWLRAARMRLVSEWRKRTEAEGAAPAPGVFSELVRRHVYREDASSPFGEGTGLWRAALWALAADAIRRSGLQPRYWGEGPEPLDLLQDLTRLLELRLRLEVRDGIELGLEGEATVLRVFHALSEKLEGEAMRCICALACRVRRALGEWR